jgi:hypothetical protein
MTDETFIDEVTAFLALLNCCGVSKKKVKMKKIISQYQFTVNDLYPTSMLNWLPVIAYVP